MGALTENRKRHRLLDHRLPSFPPHPISDLLSFDPSSPPPPLSKKAKLPSPPVPHTPLTPPPPPPAAPLTHGHAPGLPPVANPLPRSIHGPQRIIRAFGLGSVNSSGSTRLPESFSSRWREGNPQMGALVSSFLRSKRATPATPWQLGKRENASVIFSSSQEDDGSNQGLGLDQYRRLVNSFEQDGRSDVEHLRLPRFSPQESDVTAVTRTQNLEELADLHVGNQKTEAAMKVELVLSPTREEKELVKRRPVYKDLYEGSVKRYDPKLRILEIEVELIEKKISSSRLALKLQENKPKEELHEALLPLTNEEEDDVYHALHGSNSYEVLVTHEASNIEITREVLQCLSCNNWLNDEVINLYLELLKERERREPKKFLKCHFFSTFFFKKLISGKNGYDFKAVRRWTTQKKLGYGLIECDKIFVPIHKEIHWCLAVVDVKDKKFLYLDSLGGMDAKVLRVLARYLMDEVKDKSNKQIDTLSWKQAAVDDLPLQKNGWDCGMFMLKYADFYSRGSSLCFNQDNMIYFRKRTIKEILRLRAE